MVHMNYHPDKHKGADGEQQAAIADKFKQVSGKGCGSRAPRCLCDAALEQRGPPQRTGAPALQGRAVRRVCSWHSWRCLLAC